MCVFFKDNKNILLNIIALLYCLYNEGPPKIDNECLYFNGKGVLKTRKLDYDRYGKNE